MAKRSNVIVINEKDNVATAIKPLEAGATISVDVQGRKEKIKMLTPIASGHKFALQDIEKGSDVIKYGEPIGYTTTRIARGEHVHVHNVVSHRARKDDRV
jgi:altronate dehydratase small subunit